MRKSGKKVGVELSSATDARRRDDLDNGMVEGHVSLADKGKQ